MSATCGICASFTYTLVWPGAGTCYQSERFAHAAAQACDRYVSRLIYAPPRITSERRTNLQPATLHLQPVPEAAQ